MANTRHTVDQILHLADPIFDQEASDEHVENAVSAIEKLVDDTVTEKTEDLRAALAAMLKNHRYRFSIDGRCWCEACQTAERLVGGKN